LRTAHRKWWRVRFNVGGAYPNFEERLHLKIKILENLKKYHENQREKLILMIFIYNINPYSCKDPIRHIFKIRICHWGERGTL
jgi:hypothetical protein